MADACDSDNNLNRLKLKNFMSDNSVSMASSKKSRCQDSDIDLTTSPSCSSRQPSSISRSSKSSRPNGNSSLQATDRHINRNQQSSDRSNSRSSQGSSYSSNAPDSHSSSTCLPHKSTKVMQIVRINAKNNF